MQPTWLTAIPNQKKPVWNSYEYTYNQQDFSDYTTSGFILLQNWVANTILKRQTGKDDASIVTMVVPSRLPPYRIDDYGRLITAVFSFCLFIIFIPPLFRTTYRIVAEKENKVKESMRMMGLKDLPYWASWLTYYSLTNTVLTFLVWIILYLKVVSKSDGWILFLLVWLYGQSLFGIILITQSIFTRARAAAIVTALVYFGSGTFQYFVSDPDTRFRDRFWASLSPTVAMVQTTAVLGQFETSQVGSKTGNIWAEYNNFTVAHGLIVLTIDCVWLTLFGLYLEQVMPKTFGRRRHPCFFLMPSFWGCRVKSDCKFKHLSSQVTASDQSSKFETASLNPLCYEPPGPELEEKEKRNALLKISGLRK